MAAMEAPSSPEDQMSRDAALARQLQRQLMNDEVHPSTPLMAEGPPGAARPNPQAVRVNLMNDGLREVSTSRVAVMALLLVNMPQVVAAIVVLSIHWDEDTVCDQEHRLKWKIWSIFAALRMTAHLITIGGLIVLSRRLERTHRIMVFLHNARNFLDASGLIWFLVGNMWLFGGEDDPGTVCHHPGQSPIYNLCLAMIIVNYIQICLPCIVALLMVPVLCFCLPCLIHVLRWMRDPNLEGKGASAAVISRLPLLKFRDVAEGASASSVDMTCPICLSEFDEEDDVRMLPCKHYFCKACIDEWLSVNSTCPNCRTNILASDAHGGSSAAAAAADEEEGRDVEMVHMGTSRGTEMV